MDVEYSEAFKRQLKRLSKKITSLSLPLRISIESQIIGLRDREHKKMLNVTLTPKFQKNDLATHDLLLNLTGLVRRRRSDLMSERHIRKAGWSQKIIDNANQCYSDPNYLRVVESL